jgi:hypothetical protein
MAVISHQSSDLWSVASVCLMWSILRERTVRTFYGTKGLDESDKGFCFFLLF